MRRLFFLQWGGLLAAALTVLLSLSLIFSFAWIKQSVSNANFTQNGIHERIAISKDEEWKSDESAEEIIEIFPISETSSESARDEAVGSDDKKRTYKYEWRAFGRHWSVRLHHNTRFLPPNVFVRESSRHEEMVRPVRHTHCFMDGHVVGETDSSVALSVCGGLTGVIKLNATIYFLQPCREDCTQRNSETSNISYAEDESGLKDNYFGSLKLSQNKDKYKVFGAELINKWHRFSRNSGLITPTTERWRSQRNSRHVDRIPKDNSIHTCPTQGQGPSYVDELPDSDQEMEGTHQRTRRFLFSKRYVIEVLVVIDSKMTVYHGSKNVDQYVLTLMSVVSLIFRDASIGNHLNIAVVEVVKPEGDIFIPTPYEENEVERMGISAEEMLKAFCKWQKQTFKMNIHDSRRYDTALLLTRENICRNPWTNSCDTLGLAELGTMCSRHASCAIVQDNGLSAAFTIAHELGHLLNMPHDNDEKCRLLQGKDSETVTHMNVMSRMLDHNTLPWIWSNCSRHYLTEYLYAGHGRCLEDEIATNKLVEKDLAFTLAGELFNASRQCQYVFDKNSRICPYMPKCKRLWCTTSVDEKEGCRTQHMPWADGTPCGHRAWCLRGECSAKDEGRLQKRDGKWGEWKQWTPCSRTCGVGVRQSERECNNPEPKNGGKFCIGERVRYESCLMRPCPTDSVDFRTQQCQTYNGKNFGLPDIPSEVRWVPKYTGNWCGVCSGDNSTCEVTSGSLDEVQPWGYSDVVIFPEGAARIDISQRAYHDRPTDDNYLALVDLETGEYILNGNWIVTPFQKIIEFRGTLLEYTGSNTVVERINSTKPLSKKLLVQILSVGKLNRPYVRYSYTKSNKYAESIYVWRLGDWTNCSQPCVGDRTRTPYCIRKDTRSTVDDAYCISEKPASFRELCSLSCPATWKYSEWSQCELHGDKCKKKRSVIGCMTSIGGSVEDGRCEADSIFTEIACERQECPEWRYHDWAPCHCKDRKAEGFQKRPYSCEMRKKPVKEWECQRHLGDPVDTQKCFCWYTGTWNPYCELDVNPSLGSNSLKNKYEFLMDVTFGELDEDLMGNGYRVRCGIGIKRRKVVCGPSWDPQADHQCDLKLKPKDTTNCEIPCPTTTTTVGPPVTARRNESFYSTTKAAISSPNFRQQETHLEFPSLPTKERRFDERYYDNEGGHHRMWLRPQKGGRRQTVPWQKPFSRMKGDGGTLKRDFGDSTDSENGKFTFGFVPLIDAFLLDIYTTYSGRHINYPFDIYPANGVEEKPFDKHRFEIKPRNVWQTGKWSICSKDCGGGEMFRDIICLRSDNNCPEDKRPRNVSKCNTHPCTEWSTGEWGHCMQLKFTVCGHGIRQRLVVCRDTSGRQLHQSQCMLADKPQVTMPCRVSCTGKNRRKLRYKWIKTPWSECSEPCGTGLKYRNATCVDTMMRHTIYDSNHQSSPVHDDYCLRHGLPKPKLHRKCNRQHCPSHWIASTWSECSRRCGPGYQSRHVTCHIVSQHGWADPHPVPTGCQEKKRPNDTRRCNMGPCSLGYFWVTKPWKACQTSCGTKGRQRRGVMCVDARGSRVPRSYCSRLHRPRRKQRCVARPCGYRSCVEIQQYLKVFVDGEYSLLVGGVNMSVFCLAMNSSKPKEFLTLPSKSEGNFAEIYNKRLIRPDTCPYNGERRDTCLCIKDDSEHTGFTRFSKIKLNVTSLVVDTFDFSYAKSEKGRFVAYGEAGDCYSMSHCPQGSFSIDLTGTPFRVSERTTWYGHGNRASHWIQRLDDSKRVVGRCGGYCGTCSPNPDIGLKLEVQIG